MKPRCSSWSTLNAVEAIMSGGCRRAFVPIAGLHHAARDHAFARVWPQILVHVERFQPQFIILQCGADSLEGDPITHLRFSPKSHGRAARELAQLADRLEHGRVLALGGGGYNRTNLAQAWTAVVESLLS